MDALGRIIETATKHAETLTFVIAPDALLIQGAVGNAVGQRRVDYVHIRHAQVNPLPAEVDALRRQLSEIDDGEV